MLASGAGGPVTLKAQKQESLSSQLRNTANLVDGLSSVPSLSPSSSAGTRAGRGPSAPAPAPSLGLHGMSQGQFEGVVDKDVTAKVAKVLLQTMRPLKRVLKEQQEKIDLLEHRKSHEDRAEKRIAGRLSSDLKTGLMAHLKQDVDQEVHRTLTPKELLRAERAKKALKRIKSHAPKAPPTSPHSSSTEPHAHGQHHKVAAAPAHAPAKTAVPTGGRGRHVGAKSKADTVREEVRKEVAAAKGKHKGGCDPVKDLYENGAVSWC